MNDRQRWFERKRREAIERGNPDRCFDCGGGWWSTGGFVPHAPDCPKVNRERPPGPRVRWPEPGPYDPEGWYPRERPQRKKIVPGEVQF